MRLWASQSRPVISHTSVAPSPASAHTHHFLLQSLKLNLDFFFPCIPMVSSILLTHIKNSLKCLFKRKTMRMGDRICERERRKEKKKKKFIPTYQLFSLYTVKNYCLILYLSNKIPIIYAVKRKVSVLLAKDLKPILKFRFIWVKAISFLASIETVIVQLKYPNLSFPPFGICPIYNWQVALHKCCCLWATSLYKDLHLSPRVLLYQVYTLYSRIYDLLFNHILTII